MVCSCSALKVFTTRLFILCHPTLSLRAYSATCSDGHGNKYKNKYKLQQKVDQCFCKSVACCTWKLSRVIRTGFRDPFSARHVHADFDVQGLLREMLSKCVFAVQPVEDVAVMHLWLVGEPRISNSLVQSSCSETHFRTMWSVTHDAYIDISNTGLNPYQHILQRSFS
jgi:hypothetical protein